MATSDKDRYEIDEVDGLRRDIVGAWALEKHQRLRHYVDITRATRAKFARSNPAYVDLYCATGRSRVRGTDTVVEGSPLVAAVEAMKHTPFAQVHIGDLEAENLRACGQRLRAANVAGVAEYHGPAAQTAFDVTAKLHPYGLHLAFLDPYNLGALPFAVIDVLAKIKRMDLIVHISEMDIQRNIIGKNEVDKLDAFAPGWRAAVDVNQRSDIFKRQLLAYWKGLLTQRDYLVSDNIERVTGANNQPLYWLVLASRDKLADKFWAQVSNAEPQGRLKF